MNDDITDLLGKTLSNVQILENPIGENVILFTVNNHEQYILYHIQECCESVTIEDICGDIDDLINSPILMAEERTNPTEDHPNESNHEHEKKWTFYKLATIKGTVTIRWYGESNGYYSISVCWTKITNETKYIIKNFYERIQTII